MTADPDAPLWRQVLEDLEERVASGDIATRFPTDRELVEQYGVSRHTVREAVRHLKARGVIERERGRGSIVTHPEVAQPLGTLYSLFRSVEEQGMAQTSDVLALDVRPDEVAAQQLGLDPATPLFHLERVRHAGEAPLALDTVWLPMDLGEPLLHADFTRTALYDVMEERLGVRPRAGSEVIEAIVPDADLRAALELAPDEAVLRIRRSSTIGDRVVECRVTLLRGSRFALTSTWPGGGDITPTLDRG